MTLWQASLHTCQLVGDIYPLINAPTLIGISSSFLFYFIFYFFALCIQPFLNYFSDFYFFSSGLSLCLRPNTFKRVGWGSFWRFYTSASLMLLYHMRWRIARNALSRWFPNKKAWSFLFCNHLKSFLDIIIPQRRTEFGHMLGSIFVVHSLRSELNHC